MTKEKESKEKKSFNIGGVKFVQKADKKKDAIEDDGKKTSCGKKDRIVINPQIKDLVERIIAIRSKSRMEYPSR